jgi:hypothetical protein
VHSACAGDVLEIDGTGRKKKKGKRKGKVLNG